MNGAGETCRKCGKEIVGTGFYSPRTGHSCEKCHKARERTNANRRARDDAMRSCGLTKVRGALGGIYWE